VLQRFAEVAEKRDDASFAGECREQARQLAANIEAHAWEALSRSTDFDAAA